MAKIINFDKKYWSCEYVFYIVIFFIRNSAKVMLL